MSCFKTSEAGFKALLRRKGLIDEYLNILDLGRFRSEVTQWSNYANSQYGVSERLFFDEQNGTKAVPNQRAFQIIDWKKGVKYPENEWVEDLLNGDVISGIENTESNDGPTEEFQQISRLVGDSSQYTINIQPFNQSSKLVWGTFTLNKSGHLFNPKDRDQWYSDDRENSSIDSRINGIPFSEILQRLDNFSPVEREYILLSSISQRLNSDTFLGKLFDHINRELGDTQIRVISGLGQGMFHYKGHLYIEPELFINYLKNLQDSIGTNIDQYFDMGLFEELIHLVVDKQTSNQEMAQIFMEIPTKVKERIIELYPNATNPLMLVNEYTRMLIQEKITGSTTEVIKHTIGETILLKFKQAWDFILDFFKKVKPTVTTQVVNRTVSFIQDEMYQTQSQSRKQITPEVKEQLLNFLHKVNPDFRVEVIDNLSVNGLVNFSESLIKLKKGEENIALTEEVSHVFVESLTDKALKKELMDDVVRTRMYQWVIQEYRDLYGNDYEKLKREAAAKLISLWIQDRQAFNYWSGSPELTSNLSSIIRKMINWIKRHLKNPYSKSALRILKGSTDGIDLSLAQGTYYQLDPRYKEFESIQEKDMTKYGKIYVNLNNTLLDYKNWNANPVGNKGSRLVKSTFWSDFTLREELDRYYSQANLTKLGRELKDKIELLNPNRIIVFTDAPITDTLINRIEDEFGPVSIIRTGYNIQQTVYDEFGNPVDSIISGSEKEAFFMEQVNNNPTSNLLFIDNQSTNLNENQPNLKVKLYSNDSATYTDVETKIAQKKLASRNKEFNQTVIEELSKIDKENLVQLARQSMNMVKNQVRKLEGKGLEDLSSLFRDDKGNLILPLTTKANLLTRLLEDVDTFEQGLLNFVQTIESTRMFFHNANELDYNALKEEEDQDKALKEAAFLMRMILSWKQWVKEMRPYVNDTKVINRVLNDLEGELERANIKLNDIAVDLLSNNLSEQWEPFNQGKKKLLDEGVITKEQYEDSIYTPQKLVNWLIGKEGDIQTGSAYLENPLMTSEPIIQAISKRIELSMIGAQYESMKRVNDWQNKMWELSDKIGLSDEEIGKRLTFTDQENYWEDGEMKQRPALFILNEWQGLWMRKAKENELNQLRKRWQEAKGSGQPYEELELTYLNAKKDFDQWLIDNWYDEVTNEGKNIYKEFGIDDDILTLAREKQKEIYEQIRYYTNILQRTMLTEAMEENANREIERLVRELRLLRNEYTPDGNLKTGEDLLIAQKLKDKSVIDRQIYDYEFQNQDFVNALNEQILSIADESTRSILLSLIDTSNLTQLYQTSKQIAPQTFIDWLDRNTRLRYSDEFYQTRNGIIERIKELLGDTPESQTIGDIWRDLMNSTSFLRDKDMVFDASDSSPLMQERVKQFELIIESLKDGEREYPQEVFDLIQQLNELQNKRYTDYYKDVMYDQLKDIYTVSSNQNFLDLINSKEFKDWLSIAPQEFKEWFNRNHYTKLVYDSYTQSKMPKVVPTYIWMKNEPSNSKDILLIPGWKYNKRILKDSAEIKFGEEIREVQLKTPKIDWVTWNPVEGNWLPKAEQFKNPEYKRLKESKDEKDKLLFEYLTLTLNKHLDIQTEGNYDSRIGFVAPRMHTKYTEGKIGGAIKRGYKAITETLQSKEEGTGGQEQKKKQGVWKRLLAFSEIETPEQIQQVKRTDYLGNEFKTIYTPYTQYLTPEETTKNLVLSITNYSNGVEKVKALIKDLPQLNLLQQVFDQFKPKKKGTVNQYGEMIDASTNNRLNLLNHIIETKLYANVKDFELGQGVDRFANLIKRGAVVGSQSDLNIPNAVKNWLQGQLMNLLFIRDRGWGTRKSLLKAVKDHRTSYANYIYEMGKRNKSVDYHIISFFNPLLETRTADFSKSGRNTELQDRPLMWSSTASEFSVTATLLYAHLYNQDVTINGEPKKLYDAFTVQDGVLSIKPNTLINGQPLTIDRIMDLKLRFKMMMEDVLGKQWNTTMAQRYTVWQSLEFFKKFFITMFRKRFFTKRDNIELGETEGIYITTGRYFIRMIYDFLNGTQFTQALTPQERLNVKAARDEFLLALSTLFIISYLFGFDDDDEDKYKKLEDRSWLSNMALLIAINTKRETDSLTPFPFLTIQNSIYPPILNETYNFITSPFVGFQVINEGRKMLDSLILMMMGDDKAYYDRDMPAYLIEEGDSKFVHYLEKVIQIDNFLYQSHPAEKIQVIVNSQNR